ncbi:MAG: pantoate--beta-alanine ligase, partial [Pseudomonadota bacterium]
MKLVRTVSALRETVRGWRSTGNRVAVVPTMGGLHAGHISLVTLALTHADRVVTTLF